MSPNCARQVHGTLWPKVLVASYTAHAHATLCVGSPKCSRANLLPWEYGTNCQAAWLDGTRSTSLLAYEGVLHTNDREEPAVSYK